MKKILLLFLIPIQVLAQNDWVIYDTTNSPLPNSNILDIELDQFGNLWVATLSNGIYYFDGQNWENYTISNSPLPSNTCNVIKINNDELLIGTALGLVKKNGNDWVYLNQITATVTAIDIDSNGSIWLGYYVQPATEGGGLVKLEGQTYTIYNHNNSCIPCNYIESVTVDGNNDIWFDCAEDDIGVIKFDGFNCEIYNSLNGQLLWDNIVDIERGQGDSIWVASTVGISLFNGQTWQSYTNNELCIDTYLWDIELTSYNDLWMVSYATENGLVKFKTDETCTVYNEMTTGVNTNFILTLEYNEGAVWIGDVGRVMKYTKEVGINEMPRLPDVTIQVTSNRLNFNCSCQLYTYNYMIISISGSVENAGTLTPEIDISGLSNGLYFIHIYNSKQHAIFKIPKTN